MKEVGVRVYAEVGVRAGVKKEIYVSEMHLGRKVR